MHINTRLRELGLDPSRLTYQDRVIPILGDQSDLVLASFRTSEDRYRAKGGKDPREEGYYLTRVESLVKIGALAFGIRRDLGKRVLGVYELGCGLGVSALAYTLLGGEGLVAVDSDRTCIRKSQELAEIFDVDPEIFQAKDASNLLNFGMGREDFAYGMSFEAQLRHTFLRMVSSKLAHTLMCEPLDRNEDPRMEKVVRRRISRVDLGEVEGLSRLIGYEFR